MFAGRVSLHPPSCSHALSTLWGPLTFRPFVMGLQVALCALLGSAHCLSYLPGFVDSGHRDVSLIVRRAFSEGGRYRTKGPPFHRLGTPSGAAACRHSLKVNGKPFRSWRASSAGQPFSRIHLAKMSRVEWTKETACQRPVPSCRWLRSKIHCMPSEANAQS
jgi:hypothetical protein